MTKWIACWLILSLLCFTVSGAGFYLVNCQGAMWGIYPQPLYTDAWNPIEIMRWFFKMLQPPEYESPSEPSEPQQVSPPTSVDEVSNIYELVAYCNAHPDLVNQRIQEASHQYGYEVPSVTCQVQLTTTDGSGTVETTWFFSQGKFQKIEYGLTGDNVKAKIVGDEGFIVSEVKLFLKGMFEAAKNRAEDEFGKKYRVTYYNLDPPLWDSIALGLGIFVSMLSLALLTRRREIALITPFIYIAAAFIYTTPYGPPVLMFFAGITSIPFPSEKRKTESKKLTVEKFLEAVR